jgi:hypothetical protein
MRTLIVLTEEPSMKALLEPLLPKLLPNDWTFQIIPHEGKSDLEKSIPRKLKAWRDPRAHFLVTRDQDSADCRDVKAKLCELCQSSGRSAWTVRIVCRELESWVLGDLAAVDAAFNSTLCTSRSSRMRQNPDEVVHPLGLIREHIPQYQKISGARAVGKHLDPERNRSSSFQVLIRTIRSLTANSATQ